VLLQLKRGWLALVASPEGGDDAVKIHADASMYAGLFDGEESARLRLDPARKAYVHLVKGRLTVNGQALEAGDALLVQGETELAMDRGQDAEVLLFDLAA